MPDKPLQELWIALAGPAVNVVIAMGLLLLTPVQSLTELVDNPALVLGSHLITNLLLANVVLVAFNMLPAFPMDGGRVLRSLLAMRLTHLRATEIAARVGRWLALAFIVAGCWWWHIELCLVGVFVLLAGTGELFEARRRAMPNAQPWFQFRWVSVGPNGTYETSNYSSSAPSDPDVVDALDVREVKQSPRNIGY
jgi:Zn-dependent protease